MDLDLCRYEVDRYRRAEPALAAAEASLTAAGQRQQAARDQLTQAELARQQAGTRRGLRRPDPKILARADTDVAEARLRLQHTGHDLRAAEQHLAVARDDHAKGQQALRALREAQAAQQARHAWLDAHPDVVNHIRALERQLYPVNHTDIERRPRATPSNTGPDPTRLPTAGSGPSATPTSPPPTAPSRPVDPE